MVKATKHKLDPDLPSRHWWIIEPVAKAIITAAELSIDDAYTTASLQAKSPISHFDSGDAINSFVRHANNNRHVAGLTHIVGVRSGVRRHLLRGEIPPGGKCDVKTLARKAAVDRTAFYGTRPYAHLRAEFERRLQALQQAGDIPDPREANITRLKAQNTKLKERLAQSKRTIDELTGFRTQALARLAAQHEEIIRLREAAAGTTRVSRLPPPRTTVIGTCS
ncbi:hypothetical protein [Streptomyces sp. NPDC002088]|uniref:hypothetical protein n=1 Tax=Streptomyces sp. NPDC002088 TaxID=3154665 RepID=UPI003327AC59